MSDWDVVSQAPADDGWNVVSQVPANRIIEAPKTSPAVAAGMAEMAKMPTGTSDEDMRAAFSRGMSNAGATDTTPDWSVERDIPAPKQDWTPVADIPAKASALSNTTGGIVPDNAFAAASPVGAIMRMFSGDAPDAAKRDVGPAEAAGHAFIARGNQGANLLSNAVAGLSSLQKYTVPGAIENLIHPGFTDDMTDAVFRNAVDPTRENIAAYSPQSNERMGTGAKVAAALGGAAQDIPQMIATGGDSAALSPEASIAERVASALGHGAKASAAPATVSGHQTAQGVLAAGGSGAQALTAGALDAGTTALLNSITMGMGGPLLQRALAGGATQAIGGIGQQALMNQVLPESMQHPATDGVGPSALIGSILASVLGGHSEAPEPSFLDSVKASQNSASAAPPTAPLPSARTGAAEAVTPSATPAETVAAAPLRPSATVPLQEIPNVQVHEPVATPQPPDAGAGQAVSPGEPGQPRGPAADATADRAAGATAVPEEIGTQLQLPLEQHIAKAASDETGVSIAPEDAPHAADLVNVGEEAHALAAPEDEAQVHALMARGVQEAATGTTPEDMAAKAEAITQEVANAQSRSTTENPDGVVQRGASGPVDHSDSQPPDAGAQPVAGEVGAAERQGAEPANRQPATGGVGDATGSAEQGAENAKGFVTSAKQDEIDQHRRDRGLDELLSKDPVTNKETVSQARKELTDNPQRGKEVAQDLLQNPRAPFPVEKAILAIDGHRIEGDIIDATRQIHEAVANGDKPAEEVGRMRLSSAHDELDANNAALHSGGSESGKSLQASKLRIGDDLELRNMLDTATTNKRAAKNDASAKLTDDERAVLVQKHADLQAANEALQKHVDELTKAAADARRKPIATRVRKTAEQNYQDLLAQFRKMPREEHMTDPACVP